MPAKFFVLVTGIVLSAASSTDVSPLTRRKIFTGLLARSSGGAKLLDVRGRGHPKNIGKPSTTASAGAALRRRGLAIFRVITIDDPDAPHRFIKSELLGKVGRTALRNGPCDPGPIAGAHVKER